MKAVVELGGKQYLVEPGTIFQAEKVPVDKGGSYTTDRVLMILDGENVLLGRPYLDDARVTFTVLDQGKTRKVSIIKHRPKKGYLRTKGHRQETSQLQVEVIESAGKRDERQIDKKRKIRKSAEKTEKIESAPDEVEIEEVETKSEEIKPVKKAAAKPKPVKKDADKPKTAKKAPAKTAKPVKKDAAPKARKKKEDK